MPVAVLAFVLATQVAAGPPTTALAPVQSGEVVVTARADPEREIGDFVNALSVSSTNGELTRFVTRAACPAATGLPSS